MGQMAQRLMFMIMMIYIYIYGRIILNWNKVVAVSIEFICFDRGPATGVVSMVLKLLVTYRAGNLQIY